MTIPDSLNNRHDDNLIHLIYLKHLHQKDKRNHTLVRQTATVQLLEKSRCDEHQSQFLRQGWQDLDCKIKKVCLPSSVSTVTFFWGLSLPRSYPEYEI